LDPHNLLQHGYLYFVYFLLSHVLVVPFNFVLISATFCHHSSRAYQKSTYVLGSTIFPFSFPHSMCQNRSISSFGSSGVRGHTACIDNLPTSLSSFKMLKEHPLDDAMEVERIT
jgi:hypothetical protein